MKRFFKLVALVGALIGTINSADACTNFIVTRGASTDGSNMVTYAADSHGLYGALYQYVPGKFTAMMDVTEWDTGRYLGQIPQVPVTYRTLGNSNEHSLFITETTFGGRPELEDPNGRIDYGSLIYITLQRAKTAREAIDIIVDLANTHGYCSSGESFSLIDTQEAWILELIGKGPEDKGIVWVARRIPDGYVSAHANQARITTFPWNDPENCIYAPDVADVARKFGWFDGKNEEFSFADAYAPLDFGAMRGCEARVWAFFRTMADDMDQYIAKLGTVALHNGKSPLFKTTAIKVARGASSASQMNPLDLIDDLVEALSDNNVPQSAKLEIIVPPKFYKLTKQEYRELDTDNSEMMTTGRVGRYNRVSVVQSTNCHKPTTSQYHICIRTPRYIGLADALTKVEAYRPEKKFADAIKGLHLYDAKIIREKEGFFVPIEME